MKLFVDKTDVIVVKVYCWEEGGEVSASFQKTDVPSEVNVVEQIDFTFRKPNYADSSSIMKNADLKTEGTETRINVQSFQDLILRSLLIDWSMKDEDGKKVIVNNTNINNLIPSIARAAVSGVLEKVKL